MIEWLREQMGLWPGTSEFAKVNVEQFVNWLEATGATLWVSVEAAKTALVLCKEGE